ncbi:scavenger receptor cysteine-rich type 1 protein M160-like isoform X5 [Xiphophorus couchianus]|uniref:scavenger receptor cysteine-rich type 1 protein M160-like isoform X5 n=1 Tax=Xiphophorus couchianus TaxID=32473 RepID=UPI00101694F5|nr:scavenger receptor cysteine-rich type 1 protein M160-like isoform X5 [Xiphophorus couchianus]
MDQTALMLLLCLCSSALSDELRLVAGRSRCVGRLEKKDLGDWKPVTDWNWNFTSAAGACRQLHCGSVVSLQKDKNYNVEIVCSDSVRLVQGTNRCSGRLEVKTNQSWSSVCEKDFDRQDAEVVCREISCGPPSAHQGALYGEAEAPVGSREFLCEGSESALLNCSSRKSSGRNSCSPGQAVGLTCSDQDNIRLVGEASRCAGRLEMLHQEEWRPVDVWYRYWNMNSVAAVCAELDCGSAVSVRNSKETSKRPVWEIQSDCFQSGSALKNCLPYGRHRDQSHEFICSDSVRLVQGTNRCSGRLEVKTNQSWSSVCEKDFDLQDAEVVCREISCGPPSVHQGALYGEAEAPVGSREFLCEGSESALLNCSSRKSSGRNSCSPGQAVGLTCSDNFRLVGEASRCAGRLEKIHQKEWRPVAVMDSYWNMNLAAAVCAELDCGSAVSARNSEEASERPVWWIRSDCLQSGSELKNCLVFYENSDQSLEIICSDSVKLVQGTNRCSGRLEVKTNQSWSSVCEKDFDLQDAKVVCREISCGPPSAHQGALYGEAEAPVGSREFLCEGSESALLNCSSRKSSGRNSCSPGQAVGLTCSDNFRLVGEASRCAGRLEMLQQEEWRPVDVMDSYWNMNLAAAVCAELDCGSAVSARKSEEASERPVWRMWSGCFQSGSALKSCLPYDENSDQSHELICSDSVRLVQGTNRCSGRLEVKTDQSWSSVCEKDFDLQDAEVVCREIGCGPPSVHQGALYGEAEAPVGSREFLCEGSESALLKCSSRKSSGRNSCSPGQAVGLTCSDQDNIRLVGEASRCAGRLEMIHQEEWRPVDVWYRYWDMNSAAAVCAELDCGSAVSARKSKEASWRPVWWIRSDCFQSGSELKNCLPYDGNSDQSLEIICSDSVRLVQGTNRCSGRLEVKTDQSWSSVCEKDFDLQDAEVVCREISCGPPSAHQGALYGEAEAPVGSREFLCEGSESALLNCSSRKSSGRNSCSPGQAVGLTCSDQDNIRLVGEANRCAGRLEMIHQEEWRPVDVMDGYWNMNSVAAVCAELDCGSAVSARKSKEASWRPVWRIRSDCFQSGSALKNCLSSDEISDKSLEIICSGLLVEPLIFLSSSTDGVSTGRKQGSELLIGSNFSIICFIRPQYEGGSFQLIFSTSNYTQNQTLPAVNHSALFLFSAAGHAHQGTYRCVYHVYVFSYNFSSISQPLNLTVSGKVMESIRKSSASVSAFLTALIIRLVVVLLGMLGSVLLLYFKARRNQKSGPENNHHDEGSRAEGSLEEETAV